MNKAPKKTTVILALVLMTTFSAPCNGIDSEEWIAQTFCGYFWGISAAFVKVFIDKEDEKNYDYKEDYSEEHIFVGAACLVISSILKQRSVNCFKTIDNQPTIDRGLFFAIAIFDNFAWLIKRRD